MIDYRTTPARYKHWRLDIEAPIAYLKLDVDEHAGLSKDYQLKLNSYDLSVDIELSDAVQRLRFEHPGVRVVVLMSNNERVFSAGANIGMLGHASHGEKVNFCKFTNETRNAVEDATQFSAQRYVCAIRGAAVGGGYELALATDYIILVDDGTSAVSLPEVPLLAVLPGTGGLTRLVDKRKVRRDFADVFCTLEEGVRGKRAVEWRLVDELVATSRFEEKVREVAIEFASRQTESTSTHGVPLTPIQRCLSASEISYRYVSAVCCRETGTVEIVLRGPDEPAPETVDELHERGCDFWSLAIARELDDLILHLRSNEAELGTWVLCSRAGDFRVSDYDKFLVEHRDAWLSREIVLYWKRLLKRLDVTSRSLFALVEPGSCFQGCLLELVLAADRSFMLEGSFDDADAAQATVELTELNFGMLPTVTGLSRLESRYLDAPEDVDTLKNGCYQPLLASQAARSRLVTFTPDDIDWDQEVRFAIEARASFSPDALTAMEANLRFAGPETLESKIFARLTAWQNWVFQRANAVGETGALTRYGSGLRAEFDKRRV